MKKFIILTFCVFCLLACSSNRQESKDVVNVYTTDTNQEALLLEDNRRLLDDAIYILSVQDNTKDLVFFYEDNPIEIRFHDDDSFIKLVLSENRIYIPENATESEPLLQIVLARALKMYQLHKQTKATDSFYQLQQVSKLKDIDMFEFLNLDIQDLEINATGKQISDFICLYHFDNKKMALENYKKKLEVFAKEKEYDIKDLAYIKYWNKKLTDYLDKYSDNETLIRMEQYFRGNRNLTHVYDNTFIRDGSADEIILDELKKDLYYNQTDTLADIETIYKEVLLSEDKPIKDTSKLKHCNKILYR